MGRCIPLTDGVHVACASENHKLLSNALHPRNLEAYSICY